MNEEYIRGVNREIVRNLNTIISKVSKDTSVDEVETKLDSLYTAISSLNETLSNVLNSINTGIENLNTGISNINSSIATLNSKTQGIEDLLTEVSGKLDTIHEDNNP